MIQTKTFSLCPQVSDSCLLHLSLGFHLRSPTAARAHTHTHTGPANSNNAAKKSTPGCSCAELPQDATLQGCPRMQLWPCILLKWSSTSEGVQAILLKVWPHLLNQRHHFRTPTVGYHSPIWPFPASWLCSCTTGQFFQPPPPRSPFLHSLLQN